MRVILPFLFALFIFQSISVAQQSNRECTATRAKGNIKIDGNLTESDWANAVAFGDFIQFEPVEAAAPGMRTEFKLLYDDEAIYFAAWCYDPHPDSILRELGNYDDGDLNADKVRLVIDPYNTRQDAFFFDLYASGVQLDFKWNDNQFNTVWISNTKINDKGWTAEIKIPYSSIRFPNVEKQEWAIQVARTIRRTREYDQWSYTPKKENNPIKFFGTIKGIENIKPPLRLSLTPYATLILERSPFFTTNEKFDYTSSYSYAAGADVKLGLNESFTVDMTLFPDFSQVVTDKKQKNLTYREIIFDENRPFFKEGVELFDKYGLFYSRRIGNTPIGFFDVYSQLDNDERVIKNPSQSKLLNATKLTGRTPGGLGVGIINAVTDNIYATIENEAGESRNVLTSPRTNYNVISLEQQLPNQSSVSFMNLNTTRGKVYDDSNVSALGGRYRNKENTILIEGNAAFSQKLHKDSAEASTDDEMGFKYYVGINKVGGKYEYGVEQEVRSDKYFARDLGFQNIPRLVSNSAYIRFNLYNPWKFLNFGNSNLSFNYNIDYLTRERTNSEVNYNNFYMTRKFTAYFFGAGFAPFVSKDYFEPRVEGLYFNSLRYYYAYWGISTDYRKKLALDLSLNTSNFLDKFLGQGYNVEPMLRYRISNRLTINAGMFYYFDPHNVGFATFFNNAPLIGERRTNTYVPQIGARFIFKNNLAINLNARHYWNTVQYLNYFKLQNDGNLLLTNEYTNNASFSYNFANIDVLFSWQFAPGSNLSIFYRYTLEDETGIEAKPPAYGKNLARFNNLPSTNTISIRALYFLDWLYLRKYFKKKQL
ncbi:MAG: carbohydrate binding family 9 domain-containing protein [Bacteroidetes bacterium]|nr:carbohydrate binding family 9 domain-containing protein [Bacteroidota bacterium]